MRATYTFGSFRLDAEEEILFLGDDPVALGGRAVALLRVLVEQAGVPVSKDALIEAAWPGLAVEESNLTVQIAALRRALKERPGGGAWIETLPRRGYRFMGPIVAKNQDDVSSAARLLDGTEPRTVPQDQKYRKSALAVLPFTVFGGDPDSEVIADGLVEDILTALARFRLISVIARNSTSAYRGQQVDIRRVATELGARYVLEGSVRRSGDSVRISAQLIDAADGGHVWAERYDRRPENVFGVQEEVAQAIVAGMEQPLVASENRRGAPDPTGSTTDVIKAAGWHLFRFDRNNNEVAISLLRGAVSENPSAYRRHQALAMAYCWQMAFGWTDNPKETAERALASSEMALRLSDEDALNYCVLGWSAVYCDQFERGVAALDRAVQINPNSGVTHGVRAWVLGHAGDAKGAIDSFAVTLRLASQHPFIFMHATGAAWAYFSQDAWDEAIRHAETAALRRPNSFSPAVVMAAAYSLRGDISAAKQTGEAIRQLIPHFSIGWLGGFLHLRSSKLLERVCDGLRKAGIE